MFSNLMASYLAPLAVLAGVFAASAVVIGKGDGGRCLGVLIGVPGLLLAMGWAMARTAVPTLALVVVTALLALGFQIVLVLGWRRAGAAALLGAAGGYVAALAFGLIAIHVLRITGIHSPATRDLWYAATEAPIRYHWLALGGIALAGAGIIADLAIGVAATIQEVHRANPQLPPAALCRAGLRFGRDVLSTEINSLPLAIMGTGLGAGLLLLATPDEGRWPYHWLLLANDQAFAFEAVTLLAGTVALVLTIPITAGVAGWFFGNRAGTGATQPAAPRRRPWGWLLLLGLLAGGGGAGLLALGRTSYRYPSGGHAGTTELVRGRVLAATPEVSPWMARSAQPGAEQLQHLLVRLGDGRELTVENAVTGSPVNDRLPLVGDRVVVRVQSLGPDSYAVLERVERDRRLWGLLVVAAAAVVLVGRGQGGRALGALLASLGVVVVLLVALMRWHWPPVPTALGACLAMTALTFLMVCGWTPKAFAATVGATLGLTAGALGTVGFGAWFGLSGRYEEYLLQLELYSSGRSLNFRVLLTAAILIGVVGVVMDVAIGVASAVTEVCRSNRALSRRELLQAGLTVGRKLMTTMFAAIFFAYLGLNLALFVLPWVQTGAAGQLLTSERLVTEALRILASGLAILWTIPATAAVSALTAHRSATKEVTR